jgi:hypothetical protein
MKGPFKPGPFIDVSIGRRVLPQAAALVVKSFAYRAALEEDSALALLHPVPLLSIVDGHQAPHIHLIISMASLLEVLVPAPAAPR